MEKNKGETTMKYMSIEKLPHGGYKISVDGNGRRYCGYSLKNAIKQFRTDYGYKGKHLTIINI